MTTSSKFPAWLTRTSEANRTAGCGLVAAFDGLTSPPHLALRLEPACPDDQLIAVRLTDKRAETLQNPYGDLYGVGWHGAAGGASLPVPTAAGEYRLREVGGGDGLLLIVVD